MLKGYSLIYFAPERWDGLWRNRQQLMSRFAKYNKVLFVEPRLHLRPAIAGIRQGEFPIHEPTLRHISDNLYVFRYPNWAPISGQTLLHTLTQKIRGQALRLALKKLDMADPIVWFSRPGMVSLLDEIPSPKLRIYHVVDEYTAYAGHDEQSRRQTEAVERTLLKQVDIVIVVSQNLSDSKSVHNQNTYLVPNGVNYDAYTAALKEASPPEIFSSIPSPRLGYSGLVGDRLNFSLLKQIALDHPEWSLVFLGEARMPQQAPIWEEMLEFANVHYLGRVDVSEVPHYLNGFDVGLMPYAQTREADNISPLKLYDYLAAGLPVASLSIPAAQSFANHIELAEKPEDFAPAIQRALETMTPTAFDRRRAVAQQHTWDARVEQLSDIIDEHLAV
ncbi:MAG: glycosyltransferase [Chloroflexota bacterium]